MSSPLVCHPNDKRRLESVNQKVVSEYILTFHSATEERSPFTLPTVLELHHLTIRGIYPCAGQLRNATGELEITGASFAPSPAYLVENNLRDMLEQGRALRKLGPSEDEAITFASIRFHEFNCIHPFMGGNGRVGRALLHLILYDFGVLTPPQQFFDYIAYRRREYLESLRAADRKEPDRLAQFVQRGVYDARFQDLADDIAALSFADYFKKRLNKDQIAFLDRRSRASLSNRSFNRQLRSTSKRLAKLAETLIVERKS